MTNTEREKKVECSECKCLINKYQIKKHQQSIKHQTKLKGKEQPKKIRTGDDETVIMGI